MHTRLRKCDCGACPARTWICCGALVQCPILESLALVARFANLLIMPAHVCRECLHVRMDASVHGHKHLCHASTTLTHTCSVSGHVNYVRRHRQTLARVVDHTRSVCRRGLRHAGPKLVLLVSDRPHPASTGISFWSIGAPPPPRRGMRMGCMAEARLAEAARAVSRRTAQQRPTCQVQFA